MVQAIHAAEIGDAARRGNTRAAKEDHALVGVEQLRQRGGGLLGIRYCLRHMSSPSLLVGQRRAMSQHATFKSACAEPTPPLLR